ncbi:MAG TPA: glutathionylspermidine synthase family protein [Vicinamibacterales bacterium]|nr:glutathionylspermidine synthase family protein [Vicinamibacterales bacterium]
MISPWRAVDPIDSAAYGALRRRAIFDCCKWDPQVGDAAVIARAPLVVNRDAWTEVAALAEALARETRAAEAELIRRPDLHGRLGLPRGTRRSLAKAAKDAARGTRRTPHGASRTGASRTDVRLIRFDFHFTTDGWRISEANVDVPGGLNEAAGFPPLFAPYYTGATAIGDPAQSYVDALSAATPDGGAIALIHATAYSDDEQMMAFVARRLEPRGRVAHLASPAHLRWRDGRAHLHASWWRGPLDLVVRFFPAEWLYQLPRACEPDYLFSGSRTPLSNPATAILVQSKRFPTIWNELDTPLPAWRALLPETRDPRDVSWRGSPDWVVKPALGRVGEGVGITGISDAADWNKISRAIRWSPSHWVAQRRFETVSIPAAGGATYPCLGVYTLNERAIGAYGRVASRPLIDSMAQDAAVLLIRDESTLNSKLETRN